MYSVTKKILHLKDLGFKGNLDEVIKMYNGEPFNPNDNNVVKLINDSHKYCNEYSTILKSLTTTTNELELKKLNDRKNELIDIIFPGHGIFANVCDGVYATIGMVDFDGIANINKNVVFAPYTRVYCGDYTLFGSNIKVGDISRSNDGLQHVGNIHIEGDDWFCSKVRIENDVNIGKQSVIGLGATIRRGHDIERSVLAVGDPAVTKKVITRDYQSKKDNYVYRSDDEIKYIIDSIKGLGIDGDFTEYVRSLRGDEYNCFATTVSQIAELSHNLSYEYNNPHTSSFRREQIKHNLFPIMGENCEINNGLFVDLMGQAKLGDNAKLGKNAFIAGNVLVGDNVTLGDDVVASGIGHDVYYKGRRLRIFNKIFGEPCTIGKIDIKDDVKIGNNTGISPGAEIVKDVPENSIVLPNSKIIQINDDFDDVM